jgi:hypothetical protein
MAQKEIEKKQSMEKIMNFYNQTSMIPVSEHNQKINEMNTMLQSLYNENVELKNKIVYLETKMKEIISAQIQQRRAENNK